MILIVVLYAIFAATFSLGKVLLEYSSPIFLVGIRMFIAGTFLLAFQYFIPHARFKFKRKHWHLYLQAVIFCNLIPYTLRFYGLENMSASKACLLYNLGPFATYILSYFLRNEKITLKKVTGLLIGFFGMLPVLIASAPEEGIGIGFLSWSEIAVMASVSIMSYGWIVVHTLISDKDYPPAMVNGLTMFTAGSIALFTSIFVEASRCISNVPRFITILAIVIIFSNVIGHNLYGFLLKKYSPTFLSFAGFLSPLFASFYGWLFFKDTVSWEFFISLFFVFIGLGLFYLDEIKPKEEFTPL